MDCSGRGVIILGEPTLCEGLGSVKSEVTSTCQACGARVPVGLDYCPVCALRGALNDARETSQLSVDLSRSSSAFRFDHYEILAREDGTPLELGRGAMGVTYKAIDINLQCAVALKVINARFIGDQSARRRFVREARAAASVRHPNVASVFHLGLSGDGYFYAMEFVEGETLENVIKRTGQLELKQVLEIAVQVASGLAAVHKAKLVHRDIKPSNIMVSLEEGGSLTAKIIDLGLAKVVGEAAPESAISASGAFAGTPEFASPEQFAGVGVDIRSDLYSLGVVFWEMLTGRPPFRGTPAELIYQHQHGVLPLEQMKGVPQEVTVLLEMLLEKDPKRRFQTPLECLNRISTVRSELEKPARRTRLSRPKPPERSIAVLPFESLSASKKDTYFADGVQDEILSNLAKVSQLTVISRTSVMAFRPRDNRTLRSIAESLGVANVVEGTVRRDGKRVRLTIRLVDARTDKALWSESYDRDLIDVFAIQSEIAQTVAIKLSAQLTPEERKAIEAKPTEDLEAYDLYLQAKQLVTDTPGVRLLDEYENLSSAVKLLRAAVVKDSKFVLGYCLLVKAYDQLYRLDLAEDLRVLGDAALKEAVQLQPDLPDVHIASAFHLYRCYRNYARARLQIAMAQRARPNSTDALVIAAYIDREQGHLQESTRSLERAIDLDPRNCEYLRQLATNYVCLNRIQPFEHIYERIIRISPEERSFLLIERAFFRLTAKADLTSCGEALAELPPSLRDDRRIVSQQFAYALHARNWKMAKEILTGTSNEDLYFSEAEALVPRHCLWIWLARVQGDSSRTKADFAAGRAALFQRTKEQPKDPALLSALGLIDAALGQKKDAIDETKYAVEMLPISSDAWYGPTLVYNLAAAYALLDEPNLAIEQLAALAELPGAIAYGELKLDPAWDGLREDPHFEQLLTQLAANQSQQQPPPGASRVRTHKRSARSGPKTTD